MRRTLYEVGRALAATFAGSTAGACLPATDDNAGWRRHVAVAAILGVAAACVDRLFLDAGALRATTVAVGALFVAWTLGSHRARTAISQRWQIEPRRLLLCVELAAALALLRPVLEIALLAALQIHPQPAAWIAGTPAIVAYLWALGRIGADHSLQFDVPHRAPTLDGPGSSHR